MLHVQVHNMGVDEFLLFCQFFGQLSDRYPKGWKPRGGKPLRMKVCGNIVCTSAT